MHHNLNNIHWVRFQLLFNFNLNQLRSFELKDEDIFVFLSKIYHFELWFFLEVTWKNLKIRTRKTTINSSILLRKKSFIFFGQATHIKLCLLMFNNKTL